MFSFGVGLENEIIGNQNTTNTTNTATTIQAN